MALRGTVGYCTRDRHILCKRSKPPPPTADAACIAIDDVLQDRYLCKDRSKVDWLPAVEWIAQHLARMCGLLVPACYVVELEANPGEYMFGSKWEGGAEQYAVDMIAKVTNPNEFSAIYAYDLLIHNVDRHLNNYLYLQLAGDTVVKAVDHSRCLFFLVGRFQRPHRRLAPIPLLRRPSGASMLRGMPPPRTMC